MTTPIDRANVETVEIVPNTVNALTRWNPCVGPETLALFDHLGLPQGSRLTLQDEAVAILSKSVPLSAPADQQTGLVVGYVQSGKTMSFTTVAALARDNGYHMVVVIAGISKPLFNQSMTRLQRDLRLLTRPDRKWLHLPNPQRRDVPNIMSKLADWQDEDATDDEKQTVLITVMKNHARLGHLARTLSELDLQGVRALIIDDEADQAGLNNQVQDGTQSTTYSRLLSLRRLLPHHTFLQYTATPQAPLLINMIDVLSPRFADVLTPGSEYVGGKDFFIEHPHLIRIIPLSEIPTRTYPLNEPPDSLLAAMRIFFVGVAAGRILDSGNGNRSMMVHPSQETMRHAEYFRWVRSIKEQWGNVLGYEEQDGDRLDLLSDFQGAYDDLSATVENLPSFEEIARALRRSIRGTLVTEINSSRGATPNVDWTADYGHILVGGQAMDRGFTVEGLTVTYMPRSIGVGNADTIQQRARFFGYKRRYLNYCRVFLEATAARSYLRYVEHEEDVRTRLKSHQDAGLPLTEWKRAFILTTALRPTRDSVLDLDYMQDNISDGWYIPKAPHDSDDAVTANRRVVQNFISLLQLAPDQGHIQRTSAQIHSFDGNVPISIVLESLLVPLRVTYSTDSQRLIGLMIQVQKYAEQFPGATSSIYLMSNGSPRIRTVNADGEIPTLFQGANFDGTTRTYPGDREIHSSDVLTIQLHFLDVVTADRTIQNVPTVAIWVPAAMSTDWFVQEQGD